MSRHLLLRALFATLVAALVWTTVTPAEAKRPRRHSDPILEDWTNCVNGAKLTIGANDDVRLAVKSRGRTLVRTTVRLRPHHHTIWVLHNLPPVGVAVVDNPDTDPNAGGDGNEVEPTEHDGSSMRDKAATVKVFWRRPVGQTLNLGLASLTEDSLTYGTYRVDKCVLFPSTWSEGFDSLSSFWDPFAFTFGR